MAWEKGNHCFVVTDRRKKYASEYEIIRVEENDFFFLKRIGSSNNYIRARKERLFQTKNTALASIQRESENM